MNDPPTKTTAKWLAAATLFLAAAGPAPAPQDLAQVYMADLFALPPDAVSAVPVSLGAYQARVDVRAHGQRTTMCHLGMVKDDAGWKVASVNCLAPENPEAANGK